MYNKIFSYIGSIQGVSYYVGLTSRVDRRFQCTYCIILVSGFLKDAEFFDTMTARQMLFRAASKNATLKQGQVAHTFVSTFLIVFVPRVHS